WAGASKVWNMKPVYAGRGGWAILALQLATPAKRQRRPARDTAMPVQCESVGAVGRDHGRRLGLEQPRQDDDSVFADRLPDARGKTAERPGEDVGDDEVEGSGMAKPRVRKPVGAGKRDTGSHAVGFCVGGGDRDGDRIVVG